MSYTTQTGALSFKQAFLLDAFLILVQVIVLGVILDVLAVPQLFSRLGNLSQKDASFLSFLGIVLISLLVLFFGRVLEVLKIVKAMKVFEESSKTLGLQYDQENKNYNFGRIGASFGTFLTFTTIRGEINGMYKGKEVKIFHYYQTVRRGGKFPLTVFLVKFERDLPNFSLDPISIFFSRLGREATDQFTDLQGKYRMNLISYKKPTNGGFNPEKESSLEKTEQAFMPIRKLFSDSTIQRFQELQFRSLFFLEGDLLLTCSDIVCRPDDLRKGLDALIDITK